MHANIVICWVIIQLSLCIMLDTVGSVLFFSRPRSEGWPHHGRTFSIYLCHSDWLYLRRVLSTYISCCTGFVTSVFQHLIEFLITVVCLFASSLEHLRWNTCWISWMTFKQYRNLYVVFLYVILVECVCCPCVCYGRKVTFYSNIYMWGWSFGSPNALCTMHFGGSSLALTFVCLPYVSLAELLRTGSIIW